MLVQQAADEDNLGHAFAMFDSAGFVALGAGMAGGGVLIAALGARGAWLVAAGVCGLAAAATFGRSHRAAAPALRAEPELDVIRAQSLRPSATPHDARGGAVMPIGNRGKPSERNR